MSWFTSIRDAFQAAASIVGNYYLPGSGMVTGRLVSEGAQEHLGSDLGRLGMIGSGVAGGINGNMSNYGAAFNALGGVGGSTGGVTDFGDMGFSNEAAGMYGTPPNADPFGDFTGPGYSEEAARRFGKFNAPFSTPDEVQNFPAQGQPQTPFSTPDEMQNFPAQQPGAPVVERGTQFNGFPQGNGMGNDLWSMAKLAMQGSGGGGGGGSMLGNAMSVGSGVYGMYQAQKMRQMAAMAAKRADPWGESGGRAMAGGQLQGLLQDPSSITKMPGYEAGMEAVQRSMAAQGYVGSGNMMAALSKYGGDFYNNAVQQLGGLSGANQNPAASGQMEITGNVAANDLMSKGMASVGYGMTGTGGGARFTPEMLLRMKASGMIQ